MENFKGIILRSTDYKEKDKLLNIATQFGIVTVLAKGVRSPQAKLKAFVGVLTFGDFTVQSGKMGKILTSVDCEENFFNCWTDTDKYVAALLCVEVYEKCFQNDEETNEPFVLLLKALKEINYSNTMPRAIALWFILKTSIIMGIDFRQLQNINKNIVCILEVMEKLHSDEVDSLNLSQNEASNALKFFYLLFERDYGIKLFLVSKLLNCI